MKRSERKIQSATNWQFILGLLCVVFLVASGILLAEKINDSVTIKGKSAKTGVVQKKKMSSTPNSVQTARIMANGDLLYHDLLYMSALQSDGTYDFTENYQYVKPWLKKADLVLGDFEGTIRPNYPLAGYPLFNAPESVVSAIKDAGYQVVDLAHNHILDSQLEGVTTTVEAFEKQDITPIGVYTHENRDKSSLVIKKVNGIKIALLAYSYGFNGLEENLSRADYNHHLSDLNEEKMKKEIERAEKEADITVVMPQMGVEYQLEPTQEQKTLYHKMIEWGADIIFGGHPHVVEPSEVVKQNGQKKFIIYSMGNFISNQRIETMDGVENKKWTERGVLMDVTIEKSKKGTIIKNVQAHPSWVSRVAKGTYSPEGYPLYTYQTYILEDFIEGGKYRDKLDQATKERIDTAYQEMNEHVNLKWDE
ncbi:CapA family protein [Streptococcus anginosus]|uniref:CapA family protein n=1 Tax=Streptococcus anginosus TaxID=1328 RepID=UPI0022E20334|nr:CapA family protein [Streptococcus anginosus]